MTYQAPRVVSLPVAELEKATMNAFLQDIIIVKGGDGCSCQCQCQCQCQLQ
jgi:hypothetical protein